MTTFARHQPATRWCIVRERAGGSIITWCNGRWPDSDEYEQSLLSDSVCGRCFDARQEHALAELKHAPAVQTMRASDEFEMYDAGGDS